MAKSKTIPVEAYKCPKCEAIIFGNKKEDQEHADNPIYRLPIGFTFFYNRLHYDGPSRHWDFHVATIIGEGGEICEYPKGSEGFYGDRRDLVGLHGIIQPYISLGIHGNITGSYDSIRRKGLREVLEIELDENRAGHKNSPHFDLAGCEYSYTYHNKKGAYTARKEGVSGRWGHWINAREVIESIGNEEDDTLTMLTRKEFEAYRKIFSGSRAELRKHIREHDWHFAREQAAYEWIKGIRLRRTFD